MGRGGGTAGIVRRKSPNPRPLGSFYAPGLHHRPCLRRPLGGAARRARRRRRLLRRAFAGHHQRLGAGIPGRLVGVAPRFARLRQPLRHPLPVVNLQLAVLCRLRGRHRGRRRPAVPGRCVDTDDWPAADPCGRRRRRRPGHLVLCLRPRSPRAPSVASHPRLRGSRGGRALGRLLGRHHAPRRRGVGPRDRRRRRLLAPSGASPRWSPSESFACSPTRPGPSSRPPSWRRWGSASTCWPGAVGRPCSSWWR